MIFWFRYVQWLKDRVVIMGLWHIYVSNTHDNIFNEKYNVITYRRSIWIQTISFLLKGSEVIASEKRRKSP